MIIYIYPGFCVFYNCIETIILSSVNGCDETFVDYKGILLNKNEIDENTFIDLILNFLYFKEYFIPKVMFI